MSTKSDGRWLLNAFDVAASACEEIREAEKCQSCPLFATCLDDSYALDVAYAFNVDHWKEFLDLAENVAGFIDTSVYEDSRRKADIEEQMIDEEYR